MSRMLSHCVSETEEGRRLDLVLAGCEGIQSRNAAVHLIEAGDVFVNGASQQKKYLVHAGDTVVYQLHEETRGGLVGCDIPLDIRYEDDDVLVLSKQAGLVCHPSVAHEDNTLVNALVYRYGAHNLCNVQGDEDRLGIVHRLDRDTTGLMLAAKSDAAGYALMEAIRERSVDRHYLALVHGVIAHDTGMIDAPIARHAKDRTRMAIRECDSARNAVTTFTVLQRFYPGQHDNGFSLIDCKLFTGRTHQIRVHMEYTKHPLVGETIYCAHAPRDSRANVGLQRQFLHSFRLGFTHPFTEEYLQFYDNLPVDLQEVLDRLANYEIETTPAGQETFEILAQYASVRGV